MIDMQKLPSVPNWISCQDKLPEKWKEVLVILNHSGYRCIRIAELQENGAWMVSGEFWYDKDDPAITHWMPLPDMPGRGDQSDK